MRYHLLIWRIKEAVKKKLSESILFFNLRYYMAENKITKCSIKMFFRASGMFKISGLEDRKQNRFPVVHYVAPTKAVRKSKMNEK